MAWWNKGNKSSINADTCKADKWFIGIGYNRLHILIVSVYSILVMKLEYIMWSPVSNCLWGGSRILLSCEATVGGGRRVYTNGGYLSGYGRRASGLLPCTALWMEKGLMDSSRSENYVTGNLRFGVFLDAFVKPHQGLDAYSSLAMMTDR